MKLDPRTWSIRLTLVVFVTALAVGVSVVLVGFMPERVHGLSQSWMEERAQGEAVALGSAVEQGLAEDDAQKVRTVISRVWEPLSVQYAAVYRSDGTLLAGQSRDGAPPAQRPREEGVHTEGEIVHVVFPLEGASSGTLALGFLAGELNQQKSRYRFEMLMISFALIAGGFLLSGFIYSLLAAPIRRMSQVAGGIAAGDLLRAEEALGTVTSGAGGRKDEVGQLSDSFGQMVRSLRETVRSLRASATALADAGARLSSSASSQSETITRQAAALQETQVTVQEIRQTSQLATQKAEAVLGAAEQADEIGRSGEQAIEQSLGGLADIRGQVDEIAKKINDLHERTQQIGGITQTVKDLADQSNMLALNATIEAVRSGEHGKAFAVVAREIRSLADQSIQATNRVRENLDDITQAMNDAVSITDTGSARIESGLVQLNESGDNLRKLSAIVKENSAAVRQIAAAVNQQNAGIAQIVTALTDLSRLMDETVRRLDETNRAADVLGEISRDVQAIVERYNV